MNKTLQSVSLALIALAILAGAVVLTSGSFKPFTASASGAGGGFDYSTTTTSSFASATVTKQLKSIPGALGSVVISSSSPATTYSQITIYDATSTMATSTATVLARFGTNNQTMGTYNFDAAAAYGIKVETAAGYNGNATITWR